MDDNELVHYGIKGMRWGIRRENPSGGSETSAGASSTPTNNVVVSKPMSGFRAKSRYDITQGAKRRDLTPEQKHELKKMHMKNGAIVAAGLLMAYGDHIATGSRNLNEYSHVRAHYNRHANVYGISSSAYSPSMARNRRGVYKVTSM